MSDDLFSGLDELKRQRLHCLGWRQTGGYLHNELLWQRPEDLKLVRESTAFAYLAELDLKHPTPGPGE